MEKMTTLEHSGVKFNQKCRICDDGFLLKLVRDDYSEINSVDDGSFTTKVSSGRCTKKMKLMELTTLSENYAKRKGSSELEKWRSKKGGANGNDNKNSGVEENWQSKMSEVESELQKAIKVASS